MSADSRPGVSSRPRAPSLPNRGRAQQHLKQERQRVGEHQPNLLAQQRLDPFPDLDRLLPHGGQHADRGDEDGDSLGDGARAPGRRRRSRLARP